MGNKIILITGGSSGIGKAAALELHRQGAHVILQARDPEKLASAAKEIDAGGNRISCYATDLTDQDAVASSAAMIVAKEGLPDVVINSAGSGEWLSITEAEISHYKNTMDSPYLATVYTCKVFFDLMQERGMGHFIVLNSIACFFSFPGATGYTPSRWATLGFTRALQADLSRTPFKVSMIALGKVSSPYFVNNPISEERIPSMATRFSRTLSEEAAGKIVATTVRTQRPMVIKPLTMSFFVFLNRLFPGVFRKLLRKTGYQGNSQP
jgi:NADP-dependent 3-hydroxy acid dehydrogenase YdfG